MTSYPKPNIPLPPKFNASDFPDPVDNNYIEMAKPITPNGITYYQSDGKLHTGTNLTADSTNGNLLVNKANSIYLNNGMTDAELSGSITLMSSLRVKRGTGQDGVLQWNEVYDDFEIGAINIKPIAKLKSYNNNAYTIPFFDSNTILNTDSNFVYNTSGVGIGTSNPLAKLHIIQENASDALRIDDQASDTTRFLIDQSGNVSVGTNTTAVNKFSIVSDSITSTQASSLPSVVTDATLYLRRLTTDVPTVAGSYYGGSLFFGDYIGTAHLASGIVGVQTSTIPDDDQYGLAFFCHSGIGTGSVVQETMRISHDGTVCVNTTSPSTGVILDVNSSTKGIKIPSLITSAKTAITTPGTICYDSSLGDLSFRNATQWIDITRNSMTQFKATAGTTTNLGVSANIYNKLATGTITTVGDTDFVTNSENFSVIKFNVVNSNGKRAKIVVNLSYSIDTASQNLSFGIFRNATYSSQVVTVGTPLDIIQVTSPATAEITHISIVLF